MTTADGILWVQQWASPALDTLFKVITDLGHPYVYVGVLVVLYWCVDRRLGHRLTVALAASMWLNTYLKNVFQTPRPSPADGVRVLVEEDSFSFPSGHAQSSGTFWGGVALQYSSRWLWIVALLVVALIGLSRVYLGAHFIGDVLGGWAAAALALGFLAATERISARLSLSRPVRLGLAVLVPLMLVPLDPSRRALQLLGLLMGWLAGDVYALETIPYREKAALGQQVLKVLLGLVGGALVLGIGSVLPEGLLKMLGWALVGLWVTVGAPLLFMRLGLAPRSGRTISGRGSSAGV